MQGSVWTESLHCLFSSIYNMLQWLLLQTIRCLKWGTCVIDLVDHRKTWMAFSWRSTVHVPLCWMCAWGSSGCWCSWWRKWRRCSCACIVDHSCMRGLSDTVCSSRRSTSSGPGTGDQQRTCRSRDYSSCWDWPATWRWWRPCLGSETEVDMFDWHAGLKKWWFFEFIKSLKRI